MNRTPQPAPRPRRSRRRDDPPAAPAVEAPAATAPPLRPALEAASQPPKVRVPTAVDVFGHVEEYVECEDPTAIAHWDVNVWREVGR